MPRLESSYNPMPEYARFILSCILSIARLPWLWHGGKAHKIGAEIAQVLACTRDTEAVEEGALKKAENSWLKMIRRGHALRRLEAALEGRTPAELRETITQDCVGIGELLWQGTSGFCVAVGECSRFQDLNATVLRLQGKPGEVQFRAKFVIPLRALLDEAITPSTESFGDEQRRQLAEFINEVSENFSVRSVFA